MTQPLFLARRPSPAMAQAELTHIARRPIDVALAARQHHAYCATLKSLGARLTVLPALDGHPDCAFVEDLCLALPELFVITSPGAASRRGEAATVRAALPNDRPIAGLPPPATLDGGDVLILGRRIFVGRSTRTNAHAITALATMLRPFGYLIEAVPIGAALHLKTAVTALPDGRLVLNPAWIDAARFPGAHPIAVVPEETFAANTLSLGATTLVQSAAPRLAETLTAEGYDVMCMDISEFAAAEAGLTCLSVRIG